MSLRRVVITSFLLVAVGTVFAQTPQTPGTTIDPISGTWTGDIGLTDANRFPVTFELKYDGKAIAGSVKGPGTARLKAGTFDPTTDALRLELDVDDDGKPSPFIFEGIAVNGVATGRVSGNNQVGTFKLARAGKDASPSPEAAAADTAALLRKGFEEVSGWVTKSAALVPPDRYAYRPVQTVRTFGELVGHIADAYDFYCGRAAGKDVQWSDAVAKGKTDKATLAQKLKQSTDACTAVFDKGGDVGQLLANLGHTSLHYGNVITYLRMMGLVPPSGS